MSDINLGNTESELYERNKQATSDLLERLVHFHGQEEIDAIDDRQAGILESELLAVPAFIEPKIEVPTNGYDQAWIERQKKIPMPAKPAWFSVVADLGPLEPRRPRIEEIQIAVAKHYGVKRLDILSDRRTANVVRPRQMAMYLCKELTMRSLPEIGRRFGGRDHTTVLHAVRKIAHLATLATNYVASDIETIRAELRA
jgi:hypothetical protein